MAAQQRRPGLPPGAIAMEATTPIAGKIFFVNNYANLKVFYVL